MIHRELSNSSSNWLETCETAARAGARQLLEWRGRFQTREKAVCDLVTDADLASQAAIRAIISSEFPEHAFLGEEQFDANFVSKPDQFVWVVDPLDGTTNYVHGYPNYAVSVALVCGSQIKVGVIYDPLRDECYAAVRGQGATCNGIPLKTSGVNDVGDALVAVSLPPRVKRDSRDLLDFIEVTQVCQAVRRCGSAALNLAHVANGTLDAFWATHIHPWDVAAGVLLIEEAGGFVTARDGNEFDVWNANLITAANQQLHGSLLTAITTFPRN